MEEPLPLSGPIDLDALDDYLMSDHAPDDCMGLSDLDGFLTGIVVGPELILPSEWMPMIWGGDEPLFETEQEMWMVLGTIMGRYNEIAECFNANPAEFEPIFLEGPEGEVIASDWAGGFLDAVALRPKAWEPLIAPGAERAIWGIYPPKKVVALKVKAFLDFLSRRFGKPPYWDLTPGITPGSTPGITPGITPRITP